MKEKGRRDQVREKYLGETFVGKKVRNFKESKEEWSLSLD